MEWINVKDRLPNESEVVLVIGESDNENYKGYGVSWLNCGTWTSWHVKNITHWMPLPEPPKEE